MFEYKSVQHHSIIVDGKEKTKVNAVEIHGLSGTKSVTILESGKKPRTKTKRLSHNEIECIRRCKFIPGLFSDCNCSPQSREPQPHPQPRSSKTLKKKRKI